MMSTAVIGAREDAANTAPMPIRPYAPAGPEMLGKRSCSPGAVGAAEHRADEQRRREDPSRAADRDREADGDELANEKDEEEAAGVPAPDALFEYWIADPVHFGERDKQSSEEHAAGRRAEPHRSGPVLVEEILEAVEHPNEHHADSCSDESEDGIKEVLDPATWWNCGKVRKGWVPNAARPMTSAVTDASTTMPKDSDAKSPRMSSSAKNTAAIGALKVAEMPPAAPHATSRRIRAGDTRSRCPSVEPSAEPIWTIGPSRPTDPPVPMQIAEAIDFTIATLGEMRPPRALTAYITSGTP
jgi:hypothetical protein